MKTKKEAENKKDVIRRTSQKYMILVLTGITAYLFRNSICFDTTTRP
jgi:hypothetical protein